MSDYPKERRDADTDAHELSAPPAASDRCDRCGAQAKVRVVLPGGGDLVFCAHHARVYDDRIRELAAETATSEN